MKFKIIKHTLPSFKLRYTSGSKAKRIEKVLDIPKKIKVIFSDAGLLDVGSVTEKAKSFLLHSLNVLENKSDKHIEVTSMVISVGKNGNAKGSADLLLSKSAWKEAFQEQAQVALVADQKRLLTAKTRKVKLAAVRKKIKSKKRVTKATEGPVLSNALVKIIYVTDRYRAKTDFNIYRDNGFVSLPQILRKAGARYIVEKLTKIASSTGSFYYKPSGNIIRLR